MKNLLKEMEVMAIRNTDEDDMCGICGAVGCEHDVRPEYEVRMDGVEIYFL